MLHLRYPRYAPELDPQQSGEAKLQLKKVTALSCCLDVSFICLVLMKLNLKIYLVYFHLFQHHCPMK